MPDAYTNGDALGVYHTGADVIGATQDDQTACLGGNRSATEVNGLRGIVTNPIAEVIFDHYGGENGVGTGIVAGTGSTLAYKAPGASAYGTAVTIADGETKVLESADDDEWVRVTRSGSNGLTGQATLALAKAVENAVSMSNVADADSTAGITTYRAIMLKAHGTQDLTSVSVSVSAGSSATHQLSLWGEATTTQDVTDQTIADEETAPSGASWTTGTVNVGTLNAGDTYTIWLRRVVSASSDGAAEVLESIDLQFTAGGTVYNNVVEGIFRVEETALALYELYVGEDASPNFGAAPAATSATLPFAYSLTPPVSGSTDFHITCRLRNAYNLVSQNVYERIITLDSNGDEVTQPPSGPDDVGVADTSNGNVRITATYYPSRDATAADKWYIYVSGDGTDPDPGVDTPTEVAMASAGFLSRPYKRLAHTLGPYAYGSDIKVLVRSYRTSDTTESTNTTATSHSVGTILPAAPQGKRIYTGGTRNAVIPLPNLSRTVYYSVPLNVRAVMALGQTDLYSGSTLLCRFKYDTIGGNSTNTAIWTTFGFDQTAISGASSSDPVDVVTANEIYLTVNGVRRVKFDVSNSLIQCAAIDEGAIGSTSHGSDPIVDGTFWSLFQVYDRNTWTYKTVAGVDESGVLYAGIPWKQEQTTGAFE